MHRAQTAGQVRDAARASDWDSLTHALPGYSVFHTSRWARTLEQTYGLPIRYIWTAEGSSIAAFPVLLSRDLFFRRKAVSLSFSDSCPPVFSDDAALVSVFDCWRLRAKRGGWGALEIRGGELAHLGFRASGRYIEHVLDLSKGVDGTWSGLRSSTQRNIKKAERAGVQVSLSKRETEMDIYFRLHCRTRRSHGLPPQPKRFFLNISKLLIAEDGGFVAIARYEGKPVAGAVFLHNGKHAVYKFGASRKEYQDLRANNILMWEAIRWYAANGFESISFGRTDLEDSGLLQFKDGWGAERRPLTYWRIPYDPSSHPGSTGPAGRLILWTKMIVKHLPIPVLRVIGWALYKHVA